MSHLCILSTLQNITDNISEEEALIFSSGLISPVPISSTLHSFLTWGTVSFHTVLNFKNLGNASDPVLMKSPYSMGKWSKAQNGSWFHSPGHMQPAPEQGWVMLLANIYEAFVMCVVLQVLYLNDLIWPSLFSSREDVLTRLSNWLVSGGLEPRFWVQTLTTLLYQPFQGPDLMTASAVSIPLLTWTETSGATTVWLNIRQRDPDPREGKCLTPGHTADQLLLS